MSRVVQIFIASAAWLLAPAAFARRQKTPSTSTGKKAAPASEKAADTRNRMSVGFCAATASSARAVASSRALDRVTRRVAEAFTPDGLNDRLKAATLGARMFRDEVAQGVADSETELRRRYGLPSADPGLPALEAPPTAHLDQIEPKDNR